MYKPESDFKCKRSNIVWDFVKQMDCSRMTWKLDLIISNIMKITIKIIDEDFLARA